MLFLDIETDGVDQLVCVGYAFDNGEVHTSRTLPQSVRDALADVDEVVVTHSGYDVRFLHTYEGATIRCQHHDTQVMCWLHNENTELSLAHCVQRYLGFTMDKTLQKQAATAPYDDVAAYCANDVAKTRELYQTMFKHLSDDGLWDYFTVTEAPFTGTLRQMEFRGLPVNLGAAEQLEQVYTKRIEEMETLLRVGLPDAFNPRSPQHVAKLLGSSKFTIDSRIPHDDLEESLAQLAGVETGDGFETDWESIEPGTFITTKQGRKWDYGSWVVKGRGRGFNEPLESVARPAIMDDNRLNQDPWVKDYLRYRKYDKLVSTYLKVFREQARGGRVYGRFNQTGTMTGRLSSSGPNLQNIPSRGLEGQEVRSLFQGNLVVGDFSQLEPRLMAHFSQDPYMLEAFETGRDLYDDIAQRVNVSRGEAKTLVLAMSYGAGADKVASTMRLNGHSMTAGAARGLLKDLQKAYRVYFTWRDGVIAQAARVGYVETIDGRKRRLEQTGGAAWKRDASRGGRQAANAVVQGSAADIVRRVMLHTDKMFPSLKMLAQVHDELVWEYDPADGPPNLAHLETWVLRIAERGLSVPLVFEPHMGTSWYHAKEGI